MSSFTAQELGGCSSLDCMGFIFVGGSAGDGARPPHRPDETRDSISFG